MSAFSIPTEDLARHLSRVVEYAQALPAAQLSATAGQTPVKITSLPMLSTFLRPIEESSPGDIHATVHYVNPIGLSTWVRDILGDTELGEALAMIAADGRAFGFQVRDIKPLVVERVTQCAAALGDLPAEQTV